MHVKQCPGGTVMPGCFTVVTLPLRICIMHSPQLPARQPEGIVTPAASPNSSSDENVPSHVAVRPARSNRTSHGSTRLPFARAAALFTLAGPNASK
jgi:hypothetical protein